MIGAIDLEAASGPKRPRHPITAVSHDATVDQGTKARILIVEDDHFIGLEIEAALQQAGHDVVGIAATAAEAEAMARALRPDMAIMDIRLAGRRDGVEAATILYAELGIRSLFATAHQGDAEMRRRAAATRPLGWLAKPFSPSSLIEAVKAAIAQL